jgi:hypothetical protein
MSNELTMKTTNRGNEMIPQKSTARTSFAQRMGRMLGRAWRGFLRREEDARQWLTARGLPRGVAQALLLILRIAVLGMALYGAFWLAAVVIGIAVGVWNNQNADRSRMREEHEWRDGFEGYGLYCYDTRVDPYFYDDD